MTLVQSTGRILCEIPPELRSDLVHGALRLTGSVLRDTKTGKIVGFLQEAGPLGKLARGGIGIIGASPAGMIAGAVLQTASLAQGEATRRGVRRTEAKVGEINEKVDQLGDGMARVESKLDVMHSDIGDISTGVELLQSMGVANLALSAAGIGVSVVGFGIMSAKLDRVQHTVQSIADRLDSISEKIDRLRQDAIDADFSDLQSLTHLYEECWGFMDTSRAEQQWHHIQQAALVMQNRFADRARKLLTASHPIYDAADPMLDAVSLASGLRVASLVACNELPLAKAVADESSRQIEDLTGTIGLANLTANTVGTETEPGTHDYEYALVQARTGARPLLQKIREREQAVATRAAPIEALERASINPRRWLAEAREEENSPVLFLPAS